MNNLEQRIYFANLLHIYGSLLSASQKAVLIDYYDFDLSLAEIAENKGITRSAVEDAIKKGKSKLVEFEEKLHINEKTVNLKKIIANIRKNANNFSSEEILNEIEGAIKNGI